MTPLSKTFLAFMAIAVVVAGTIALRSKPAPANAPPHLTPAQLAEIRPQPKPQAQPSVSAQPKDDVPPPPVEDDLEDGNGS